MTRRRLCWFLVAVATVSAGAYAVLEIGDRLTRPARGKVGDAPPDLGARGVRIETPRGTSLRGWLVPGEPGRGGVVLAHPQGVTRRVMLDRARLLAEGGHSVLCFDFQAHGESPGQRMTFGALESQDLSGAVAWMRATCPGERIGVLGWSLGAASALLASPALDVDALVLEQPYADFEEAVQARTRRHLGPLGPLAAWLLLIQVEPLLGISASELRPVEGALRLRAPVLFLAGDADLRAPLAGIRAMYELAPEPKQIVVFEGATHIDLLHYARARWEGRVLPFLERHLVAGPR